MSRMQTIKKTTPLTRISDGEAKSDSSYEKKDDGKSFIVGIDRVMRTSIVAPL